MNCRRLIIWLRPLAEDRTLAQCGAGTVLRITAKWAARLPRWVIPGHRGRVPSTILPRQVTHPIADTAKAPALMINPSQEETSSVDELELRPPPCPVLGSQSISVDRQF